MKYLILLLCFYCTARAQDCKLTPKDVTCKWQLVATTAGFNGKGIEHANSTEFVTFTATTFTFTKNGKTVKSGTYTFDKTPEGCLLKLDGKTYKMIQINNQGELTLSDYVDDAEVNYYKK